MDSQLFISFFLAAKWKVGTVTNSQIAFFFFGRDIVDYWQRAQNLFLYVNQRSYLEIQ